MDLPGDTFAVIVSKLDPKSLESLQHVSKSVKLSIDTALANNYTYYLMTQELLGIQLPNLPCANWKNIYDFFIAVKPRTYARKKGSTMTPYQQRLDNALYSSNPNIVKIALFAGADPSIKSNAALSNALLKNVEIAEILLQDDRVSSTLTARALLPAFQSGKMSMVKLVLNIPNVKYTKDDKIEAINEAIKSGNIKALKLTQRKFGIRTKELYNPVSYALCSDNPIMVKYMLDKKDASYDEESFTSSMMDSMPTDEVLQVYLRHPRILPMIEGNKSLVFEKLIREGRTNFVDEMLQDPTLDVSDNNCQAFTEAIEAEDFVLVKTLFSRLDELPSNDATLNMLSGVISDEGLLKLLALFEDVGMELNEDASIWILKSSIDSQDSLMESLIGNEFLIINKNIAKKVLLYAIKENSDATEILLAHPRTSKYYTKKDRKRVDNM